MKKILTFVIALMMTLPSLYAKEGMWLPILLQLLNEKEMQEMGMKITTEDIYSVNNASLKDAIVIFGGGCTGEIVSNNGLLFTNHHCGYGAIQQHSSIDHDYLTNGFWAKNKNEELPCEGLKVTLLVRMEEVTDKVLKDVTNDITEVKRREIIKENSQKVIDEATKDTHYKASVEEFFYGNNYYLFVYEVFEDVRLVGAPPSNIGKFGGDTDNWMWPRHTGDFSVFRIYADKDNKPAKYSKDNKPYTPKKFLKISLKGYEQDDFTFVFGYPGSTNEYLPASAIKLTTDVRDDISISVRDLKLKTMNAYSDADPKVRIQYASKTAGVANGWKKWKGEVQGIKRFKGIETKTNYEKEFTDWCNKNNKKEYLNLLPILNEQYEKSVPYEKAYRYFVEAGLGMEIVRFSANFRKLVRLSKVKDKDKESIELEIESLLSQTESFFKDYHQPIDEELTPILLKEYYENVPQDVRPDFFNIIDKKYNGDFDKFSQNMFKKTMFTDKDNLINFLNNYKPSNYKKLEKDPAYAIYSSLIDSYVDNIYPELSKIQTTIDSTMRFYVKAQMEFEEDNAFYPDANFTLRVTYGKIEGFKPFDGANYNYFTTLDGVMEKEDPNNYDYVVVPKLKQLYTMKDYGRYADKDGTMHTCFIGSNHTTGGNSGSPVLNAEGHLIGLNFDRNWQGTMSDLIYDPDMCRNIMVDIRYCLFIIDKFAGAGYLLDEMEIIE
ncbi:MAG: S46 family peptidase [Bacteroidales bacterium]|jgi:hypothetical protein